MKIIILQLAIIVIASQERELQLLDSSDSTADVTTLTCESDDDVKKYLSATGECITCEDYFYADKINKECVAFINECDSGNILLTDGTCEKCADFTYVDESGKSCISDTCVDRQILLVSGVCFTCSDYSYADSD